MGEISGSFTKKEVSDLADVLNAGSLPVRIRPAPAEMDRSKQEPGKQADSKPTPVASGKAADQRGGGFHCQRRQYLAREHWRAICLR